MKKQALYIIPALLAAGAVSAQGFDGFYVGAAIGDSVTVGSARASGTTNYTLAGAPNGSFYSSSRAAFKKENFAGSLFAGYGWGCDCWYLGGEIFVKGFGKHSGRNNFFFRDTDFAGVTDYHNLNVHAKLRSAEWGIDFRPGFLIGECTMLYGRIGAAFNRIHVDFTRTVARSTAAGTTSIVANDFVSNKKSRASLRLGAGLEHRFCDCWSIRVDWVYTSFRKHNQTFTSTRTGTIFGTANSSATANTKIHNHTTMFGLSYYW